MAHNILVWFKIQLSERWVQPLSISKPWDSNISAMFLIIILFWTLCIDMHCCYRNGANRGRSISLWIACLGWWLLWETTTGIWGTQLHLLPVSLSLHSFMEACQAQGRQLQQANNTQTSYSSTWASHSPLFHISTSLWKGLSKSASSGDNR